MERIKISAGRRTSGALAWQAERGMPWPHKINASTPLKHSKLKINNYKSKIHWWAKISFTTAPCRAVVRVYWLSSKLAFLYVSARLSPMIHMSKNSSLRKIIILACSFCGLIYLIGCIFDAIIPYIITKGPDVIVNEYQYVKKENLFYIRSDYSFSHFYIVVYGYKEDINDKEYANTFVYRYNYGKSEVVYHM